MSKIEVTDARHKEFLGRDIEIRQGMAVTGITLAEARQLVADLPLLIARIENDTNVPDYTDEQLVRAHKEGRLGTRYHTRNPR